MVDQLSSPMPGSLRSPRTRLIGRESDVAQVRRFLLEDVTPLVTLTGPGGVGKTQLAHHAAHGMAPHFADGVVFVPLAAVAETSFVPSAIAQAIDVPEFRDEPVTARLVSALRERHLLLVLDNFEHLLPAATVVADLLAECPFLTVLATSRTPLGVSSEQRFPVPPLAVPDATDLRTAADASQSTAVRLFIARARAARPSFALTDANAGTVAEIVRRVDGLPLAIELAAARIAVLSPEALLDRLDRRLSLLTGGPRDAPPRLRTMRDAIAWSYDLLTSEEQALFRGLSVFKGGFTLEAVQAIARATGNGHDDILDSFCTLVSASLVQPIEMQEDTLRYQLLETVREFGLERMVAAGEETMLREAHRNLFLTFVERIGPLTHGPGSPPWLDQLAREHHNVRAALSWSMAQGNAEAALRMSGALLDYWTFRGHLSEAYRWLAASLAIGDTATPPLRALALYGLGSFAGDLGDQERGIVALEESLALYRVLGDRHGTGQALTALGCMAEDAGEFATAERLLTEARSCFEELGNTHCMSQTIYHLGIVAQGQGDLDLAMARYEAAQGPARDTNDYFNIATTLWYQGHIHCIRGEFARAADALEEAMEMERALGHVEGAAPNFATLAMLAEAVGLPEAAARILGTAMGVMTRQGLTIGLPERIDYEQVQTRVRDQLGDTAFQAAWSIGQARTIAESTADVDVILAAGRSHVSPTRLPERIVELGAFPRPSSLTIATAVEKDFGLTQRQLEILPLLCQRLTDREIAERLFLSARTVEGHVTQILSKFGVANRREAAAFAARQGLVDTRLTPAS